MRLRGRPRKSGASAGAGAGSGSGSGQPFSVGAEVEVRSDDDGFRGAWYGATVLRRLNARRRFVVAYDSLVAGEGDDGDPSRPLRESVRRSHMRPRPPRTDAGEVYGLHQLVEAYHHDGWWAGLVAGVEGAAAGRYTVCFPDTREVVEFPAAEVRPRMEWARGQWVPVVPEQEVAEPLFSPGAEVEAYRVSDTHGMGWFRATVVKVIGAINFMVEYQTLSADGSDREKLKEILVAQYIRPAPPAIAIAKDFGLKDEVEVYHDGGWYVGFIWFFTETPGVTLGGLKYIVRFKQREELEVVVDRSNLRVHQEWIGRRWICCPMGKSRKTPTKDIIKSPGRKSKSGKSPSFSTPSLTLSADVGEHMLEWQSSTVNSKRRRTERSKPDIHNQAASQPRKKSRKVKSLDRGSKSPSTVETGFHVPVLTKGRNPGNASSMDKQYHSTSTGRMLSGVSSVATKKPWKASLMDISCNQNMAKMNGKTGHLIQEKEPADIICEKSVHCSAAQNFKYTPNNFESIDCIPIAQWESVKGLRDIVVNTLQRRRKLTFHLPQLQSHVTSSVSVNALEATKPSNRIRRPKENVRKTRTRYSSPKEDVTCLNGTLQCMELHHAEVLADQDTERELGSLNIQLSGQGLYSEISCETPLLCYRDEIMEHEDSPYLVNSQDLLLSDVTNINLAGQLADMFEDGNVAPGMESFSVNGLVANQLSDMRASSFGAGSEDSLASNNSLTNGVTEEENHIPLSLVENKAVILQELSHSEMPSKDIVVEHERALINPSSSETSSMEVTLPFEKCSSMWESIESMEVFKIMPQRPHFQPLHQYCAVFREGMAIGLMVTFANLVSDFHKLRIDDSLRVLNEKLETLRALEANGFDVERVRTRIKKLLDIQNNQTELEAKRGALERKKKEKMLDNDRLDAALTLCDNSLNEIKQSLARLHEKRASVALQRMNNDSEILKLQEDVLEAEEECLSIEHHFANALDGPW